MLQLGIDVNNINSSMELGAEVRFILSFVIRPITTASRSPSTVAIAIWLSTDAVAVVPENHGLPNPDFVTSLRSPTCTRGRLFCI